MVYVLSHGAGKLLPLAVIGCMYYIVRQLRRCTSLSYNPH